MKSTIVNRESLEKDGYFVLKNFLKDHHAHIKNNLTALTSTFSIGELSDIDDALEEISSLPNGVRDFKNYYLGLMQRRFVIYNLCLSAEIRAILVGSGLLDPYLASDPLLMFSGGSSNKFLEGKTNSPLHQDWASMQSSENSVIIWLPLTEYGRNGYSTIGLFKGSHKLGLCNLVADDWFAKITDERILLENFNYEVLSGNPGDLILFSSLLCHRTVDTDSGRTRLTYQFRYGDCYDPLLKRNKFYFNYDHCVPIKGPHAGHLHDVPKGKT